MFEKSNKWDNYENYYFLPMVINKKDYSKLSFNIMLILKSGILNNRSLICNTEQNHGHIINSPSN